MGKYMRKGKGVGEVAVMEVSQGSLGVRTRARALALEKDRKLAVVRQGSFKPQQSACDDPRQTSYLELRSRRLEKVVCPISRDERSHSRGLRKAVSECRPSQVSSSEMFDDSSSRLILSQEARQSLSQLVPSAASEGGCQRFEGRRGPLRSFEASLQSPVKASPGTSLFPNNSGTQREVVVMGASISRSNSVSISQDRPRGILTRNQRRQEKRIMMAPDDMEVDTGMVSGQVEAGPSGNNNRNIEVEASFSESPMDHDGFSTKDSQTSHALLSGRRIREGTPSSYIRDMEAPGSSSRPSHGRPTQGRSASAPPIGRLPDAEIEDFFRGAEQQERRRFTERYNFDPVNDRPLPGRYEWVSMQQHPHHL